MFDCVVCVVCCVLVEVDVTDYVKVVVDDASVIVSWLC